MRQNNDKVERKYRLLSTASELNEIVPENENGEKWNRTETKKKNATKEKKKRKVLQNKD